LCLDTTEEINFDCYSLTLDLVLLFLLLFQKPRPLRQSDLERALSMSRKGKKAASSALQSPLWVRPTNSEDDQVQNAIFEISKLMSRIVQNSESEPQEPSSP
jgi:ATPase family AAA domain-containing protein 1